MLGVNRKLFHYRLRRRDDEPLRLRLIALALDHRRFGLPRLTVLLRRDGFEDNHKRIGRVYRAANLQVWKRVKRKLALGRGPVDAPALAPNDRWSLDFVHDRLRTNRRFRILGVGDDCTRENLALEADFAFSGRRMTYVLDAIAAFRRIATQRSTLAAVRARAERPRSRSAARSPGAVSKHTIGTAGTTG